MQIKKFDSINVVPFIDIMLVLLVIVLTTASFVAKGIIPIDLSEGKASDTLTLKKELVITIEKDGTLFLDKQMIANSMLEEKLLLHVRETPILINCDKNSKFELFMQVIDVLNKHDYKNLAVIAKK